MFWLRFSLEGIWLITFLSLSRLFDEKCQRTKLLSKRLTYDAHSETLCTVSALFTWWVSVKNNSKYFVSLWPIEILRFARSWKIEGSSQTLRIIQTLVFWWRFCVGSIKLMTCSILSCVFDRISLKKGLPSKRLTDQAHSEMFCIAFRSPFFKRNCQESFKTLRLSTDHLDTRFCW